MAPPLYEVKTLQHAYAGQPVLEIDLQRYTRGFLQADLQVEPMGHGSASLDPAENVVRFKPSNGFSGMTELGISIKTEEGTVRIPVRILVLQGGG